MSDKKCTLSGKPANQEYLSIHSEAPQPLDPATGMHKDYWVICEKDRAKGFVRPVRSTYIHERCGLATSMARAIAETYARNPKFYGATFCSFCGAHFPVGANGEFVWKDDGTKVGS